jgi:structural maintenance of chromosome 3 (chondroitin sulfate proteoglycan 6)
LFDDDWYARAVNKVTAAGIASISRLAEEHRVRGVYGPLIELFQCPEAMSTAVEVTAGGSLFHVVVASDDVASQLIELMHQVLSLLASSCTYSTRLTMYCSSSSVQEGSSARVTFMPLNRIRTEDTHMPSTEEARPLLAQLTYNPMFLPAMKLVRAITPLTPRCPTVLQLTVCSLGVRVTALDRSSARRSCASLSMWPMTCRKRTT